MTTTTRATQTTPEGIPVGGAGGGLAPGGMWWFAWRQHRKLVLTGVGLLGVVAIALVVLRLTYESALAGFSTDLSGCVERLLLDQDTWVCAPDYYSLNGYFFVWELLRLALLALPVLIGGLAGAAVVATDRERGTHVFALTQSVTRTRWFVTKCAVVVVPLVAAQLLVGVAAEWSGSAPGLSLMISPLDVLDFQASGAVPAAFLVLALGLAIPIGAVMRSLLPAVVVALALGVVAVGGIGYAAYQDLVPHERTTGPVADYAWDEVPEGALVLGMGIAGSDGQRITTVPCPEMDRLSALSGPADDAAFDAAWAGCLDRAGVTERYAEYIDAGQYGRLVVTLWAICAAVAAAGIGFGWWRVRRSLL